MSESSSKDFIVKEYKSGAYVKSIVDSIFNERKIHGEKIKRNEISHEVYSTLLDYWNFNVVKTGGTTNENK